MSEKDEMEVSESQIAVHWQEEDYRQMPMMNQSMTGSAWTTFLTASRNMPISWIGTRHGIQPLIQVTPLCGNGLSAASSM
jgi:hypothetical protein